jgi:predicted RNA-binding Zn-ribbon protein involved in translation (DUF1610 family)
MLGGIISLFIILALCAYFAIDYRKEKTAYNSGICPKCGSKMNSTELSASGNRKYTCPDCDYYTWVSYKSIK